MTPARLLALFALLFSTTTYAQTELTPKEKADGWISLYNGKDLSDWKADKWNPGGFSIEDGAIKCHGKPSMLYYDGPGKEMKDLHFVADVMTKPSANSGIFFHTQYQDKGWPRGHEAQVNATHRDPVKTGSVYIVAKYLKNAHKDSEWFRYEIIVRGNTIVTKVNGETLVAYKEENPKGSRKLSSGTIGLQAHDPGSVVYYKNIKVKPLTGAMSRADRVSMRSGQWYEKMDFGPALATHVGTDKKVIVKGLAVRLGDDESATIAYDTEMLSANAAWNGFLQIAGTPWNGKHGGNPSVSGTSVFSSDVGPGWAKNGSFEDPRNTGYGPLPRDWAKYKGRYVSGNDTVISYTVGGTQVYEHPSVHKQDGNQAFIRTFNIPKTTEKMTLRVVNQNGTPISILGQSAAAAPAPQEQEAKPLALKPGVNVVIDRIGDEENWDKLMMGAPSSKDDASGKTPLAVTGKDHAKPHESAGAKGNKLPRLTDGKLATNNDDVKNCTWFDGNKHAFILDLGSAIDVSRINTYSWHKSDRSPQRFRLYGSTDRKTWKEIAKVDTKQLGNGGKHASSVLAGKGKLGTYQFLRWTMPKISQGAFFTEIDVFDVNQKLPIIRERNSQKPLGPLHVGVSGNDLKLYQPTPGQVLVDVPAGKTDLKFNVIMAAGNIDTTSIPAAKDLSAIMKGGPIQWPETIEVKGTIGKSKPYATDEIPLPEKNPWESNIRFSGFDFFADGKRLAICTWNGDVWIASGIDAGLEKVTWKRYAAGLFETLGLKIVDDVVYVTGKDQITRLHDLNSDGEADFYECFNNDIMITKNFHEFTFGLQTDKDGNFYFAKGAPVRPGGRGFDVTHAHHGVVYKVSKDGKSSEVWANGLRAPGGLGVGPNGEVTTGENEGTYAPACKINWASKGSFSGVVHPGNGRTFEQGYDKPLCWMPMWVDNSGGGQIWVDNDKWGPFNGELLHLSYGRSTVYKVMRQEVNGTMQGGVVQLPIKLSSSAMRARFNPVDKQLYVSGFRGWQTNAAKASAVQRIRLTGDTVNTPTELRATKKGLYITFTNKLDPELAEDLTSYSIKIWQYVWGPQYGSGHFSILNPDKEALAMALKKESKAGGTRGSKVAKSKFTGDTLKVESAKLQADGKTVFLGVPNIQPAMQMQIGLDVETEDGDEIITTIYNTIHNLAN